MAGRQSMTLDRASRNAPPLPYPLLAALLPFLLGLLAAPGDAVEAQTVEGQVTWADGAPVEGATATLVDAAFQQVDRGVTDADGRYRLAAPAPGDYMVLVDVEGYSSQVSELLSVGEGDTTTLDVEIAGQKVGERALSQADTLSDAELLAALIADACRNEFIRNIHGILLGSVRDAATGSVIPGATITVQGGRRSALSPFGSRIQVRTDNDGVFLVCKAPAAQDLKIQAVVEGTEGEETVARVQPGTMKRLDLTIPLYDPDEPGDIVGHVVDQERGTPLEEVEVRVKGLDASGTTNARGVFQISGVPWGRHTLVLEHPFYGQQEQTVQVVGGRAHDLRIYLTPKPVEMPPILVRVKPRSWYREMNELQHRIDLGLGHIMTRTEIAEKQPMHLADVLRDVPGVDVRQSGSSMSGTFVVQMRNAQNMAGQVCQPAVWVDGQKWRYTRDVYTNILGIELDVVEVYRGPAEVPGEFLDSGAQCGAIIVWTRRGRDFPG